MNMAKQAGVVTAVMIIWFFSLPAQANITQIEIEASTREARTALLELGVDIIERGGELVYGFASEGTLERLRTRGYLFREVPLPEILDFPTEDSAYHNYDEMYRELEEMAQSYPQIARLTSIGLSYEKRALWALQIANFEARNAQQPKPAIVYFGAHHAREHLSVEVPLALARHLLENYGKDALVTKWVNEREIWIIPMVNPDGAEYDIANGMYRYWRKNRALNLNGTRGVDLNRNYAFGWGGTGASPEPDADTYRGPFAFSEPESAAARDFLKSLPSLTTVISYHTFSELILYPWGHRYDRVPESDYKAFIEVTNQLGAMTGYSPMQASSLYLASGDTVDWSYGELGAFALTFELSPASMWDGGFYPGGEIIPEVLRINLPAALYLLELAADPFKRKVPAPEEERFLGIGTMGRWLAHGALWRGAF